MKVGDLIECHKGAKGLILDTEDLYPGHPHSPLRGALVLWIDEPPTWHREGLYVDIFAIKKIKNHENW